MNKILGGICGLLLFIAVASLAPSVESAGKWINVIPGVELYGCVPDELAVHLLSGGGFATTGSPVVILCISGYTPVYRVLP